MPRLIDRMLAWAAYRHAARSYDRFKCALTRLREEQHAALGRALRVVAGSRFARDHGLARVHTPEDLRAALPLQTYEDLRPYMDRVWQGELDALLAPGVRVLMFATTSGTTCRPKLVPVTPDFVCDYRRGWNVFGLKVLQDHPAAILRPILQSSGRYDAARSPSGVPCGAITGLIARTQKRIVRRYYVGRPEIAEVSDARARYYVLMRLGIVRDVAFGITANPATLIQMARTADEQSERLIRDVRDGTLSTEVLPDRGLSRVLSAALRPDPARAAALERYRALHGSLRPRDYWRLTFLACWTGGSMGHYLGRLREWYGEIPIRDVGLLASEGRVSIPLQDRVPAGVLEPQSALFEFIPTTDLESPQPRTLWPWELETGQQYAVVLTTTAGLVRYRLDDVVRVHGWMGQAPVLEFRYRAGRVSSIAGEKLTESHATEAVRAACRTAGLAEFDFVLAPCWGDPPLYRLSCEQRVPPDLAAIIDQFLCEQNEEYESRRKSFRLGQLRIRVVDGGRIGAMDARLIAERGCTAEQYKRPCLFMEPGADDAALRIAADPDLASKPI